MTDGLLDTHTLLWFVNDAPELPSSVRDAISDPDNVVSVSVASLWEIGIKSSLGKLPLSGPLLSLESVLQAQDIAIVPISVRAIHLITDADAPQRPLRPHHRRDVADLRAGSVQRRHGL